MQVIVHTVHTCRSFVQFTQSTTSPHLAAQKVERFWYTGDELVPLPNDTCVSITSNTVSKWLFCNNTGTAQQPIQRTVAVKDEAIYTVQQRLQLLLARWFCIDEQRSCLL